MGLCCGCTRSRITIREWTGYRRRHAWSWTLWEASGLRLTLWGARDRSGRLRERRGAHEVRASTRDDRVGILTVVTICDSSPGTSGQIPDSVLGTWDMRAHRIHDVVLTVVFCLEGISKCHWFVRVLIRERGNVGRGRCVVFVFRGSRDALVDRWNARWLGGG